MKDRCHPHEGTTEVIVLLEWGQVHEETNKTKGSSLKSRTTGEGLSVWVVVPIRQPGHMIHI